jgi:hypothetical protein
MTVPELTGPMADTTYQVIALAGDGDDRDGATMSGIIVRGIDAPGDVAAGPWLDLATSLDESSGEFSFEPVEGSALHAVTLRDADDNHVWDVAILDDRTSFTLPVTDSEPLPEVDLDMSVAAFDGDIDVRNFSIDDVFDLLDRISTFRDTVR